MTLLINGLDDQTITGTIDAATTSGAGTARVSNTGGDVTFAGDIGRRLEPSSSTVVPPSRVGGIIVGVTELQNSGTVEITDTITLATATDLGAATGGTIKLAAAELYQ